MSFKFDRKKIFDGLRSWRGVVLPQQVQGLNFLFDCIEQDEHMTRLDWISYALATTMHETAYTFLPVHEYGGRNYFIQRYGGQTRKGKELGNDTPEEGYFYAGRGDVQLTGESNYEKAEDAIRREYPELIARWEKRTGKKFDLTVGDQPNDEKDPDNAQDPEIAYAIMSYGMRTGMFTGKKLSQYFNNAGRNWNEARRIINGLDHAGEIADKGRRWLMILEGAVVRNHISEPITVAVSENNTASLPTPASNPTDEPTTTVVTETKTDDTTAVQQTTVTQSSPTVNQPEAYNQIGFWATIKRDLAATGILNGGTQGVFDALQKAQALPEWLVPIIIKLIYALAIFSALYLTFRVIHWLVDTWKQNQRVKHEKEGVKWSGQGG